jgi:hypothetical protein
MRRWNSREKNEKMKAKASQKSDANQKFMILGTSGINT